MTDDDEKKLTLEEETSKMAEKGIRTETFFYVPEMWEVKYLVEITEVES